MKDKLRVRKREREKKRGRARGRERERKIERGRERKSGRKREREREKEKGREQRGGQSVKDRPDPRGLSHCRPENRSRGSAVRDLNNLDFGSDIIDPWRFSVAGLSRQKYFHPTSSFKKCVGIPKIWVAS